MSWRRFRVLYSALGPQSQVCLNYDRIARREGLSGSAAEAGAWRALTGLQRPNGR